MKLSTSATLVLLLASSLFGQISPPPSGGGTSNFSFVTTSPSGACTVNSPNQQNTVTGVQYTCANGTWAIIAGSGGPPSGSAGGDVGGTYPGSLVVNAINATSVPTNSAADQVLLTTSAATGAWKTIAACLDTTGNHLNYNSATHAFSCGSSVPANVVVTNATNAFGSFLQDFSTSTLRMPVSAGAAPTISGYFAYDNTANLFKGGVNGSTGIFPYFTTLATSGHCVQWGAGGLLTDAGAACGSGGGSPGGSANAVQYNNSSAFGGDAANFSYNAATHIVTTTGGFVGLQHSQLPALVGTDIPNNNAQSGTTLAFALTPTQCGTNIFSTGISTTGGCNGVQPSFTNLSGSLAHAQLPAIGASDVGPTTFSTDSGTTNAYIIAPSPAVTSLAAGVSVTFTTTHANSGASTLQVSGLTNKTLTKNGSVALVAGDILAGAIYQAIYDGTQWEVNNPSTGITGTVSASSLTTSAIVTGSGTSAIQTPSTTATVDSSGNIVGTSFSTSGTTGGQISIKQGTAPGAAPANSFSLFAPTGIATGYKWQVPTTDANGILSVASDVITLNATQGTGAKIQASTGTATSGHCVQFDATGNTVDAGAACGTGGGASTPATSAFLKGNGSANGVVAATNTDLSTAVGTFAVTCAGSPSTNDTTTITTALALSPAGRVFISPAQPCYANIGMLSGQSLIGVPNQSIIRAYDGTSPTINTNSASLASPVVNVVLDGLIIDGNGGTLGSGGVVYTHYARNFTVKNTLITSVASQEIGRGWVCLNSQCFGQDSEISNVSSHGLFIAEDAACQVPNGTNTSPQSTQGGASTFVGMRVHDIGWPSGSSSSGDGILYGDYYGLYATQVVSSSTSYTPTYCDMFETTFYRPTSPGTYNLPKPSSVVSANNGQPGYIGTPAGWGARFQNNGTQTVTVTVPSALTCTTSAAVLSSNVATYTCANTFSTGDYVTTTGFTPSTFNVTKQLITAVTSTTFKVAIVASGTTATVQGTATDGVYLNNTINGTATVPAGTGTTAYTPDGVQYYTAPIDTSIAIPTTNAVLTTSLTSGAITGCTISSGGSGYPSTPTVYLSGNGALTVTISGGVVNSCTIATAGSGYGSAPTPIVAMPIPSSDCGTDYAPVVVQVAETANVALGMPATAPSTGPLACGFGTTIIVTNISSTATVQLAGIGQGLLSTVPVGVTNTPGKNNCFGDAQTWQCGSSGTFGFHPVRDHWLPATIKGGSVWNVGNNGSQNGSIGNGIHSANASGLNIDGVTIHDTTYSGFRNSSASYNSIVNSKIQNTPDNCVYSEYHSAGIRVIGNDLSNCGDGANFDNWDPNLSNTYHGPGGESVFANNIVTNVMFYGVHAESPTLIEGNTFNHAGIAGIQAGHGNHHSQIRMINNHFKDDLISSQSGSGGQGFTLAGIAIEIGSPVAFGHVVSGNTFEPNTFNYGPNATGTLVAIGASNFGALYASGALQADTLITNQFLPFAQLGSPDNGSQVYVPDAYAGPNCTGSGTGATATRQGGSWSCGPQPNFAYTPPNSAGAVTLAPALSIWQQVIPTQATTVTFPSGTYAGQNVCLYVHQGGTGFAVTLAGPTRGQGTVSATASARSTQCFQWTTDGNVWASLAALQSY